MQKHETHINNYRKDKTTQQIMNMCVSQRKHTNNAKQNKTHTQTSQTTRTRHAENTIKQTHGGGRYALLINSFLDKERKAPCGLRKLS